MFNSGLSRATTLFCLLTLVISGTIAYAFQSGGNIALNKPAQQSSTSSWSRPNDPQGAVDGIKNGSFGFHTNLEKDPWWQLDLLSVSTLNEIRVFNRLDCCTSRAETIQIFLSEDGKDFKKVFPPTAVAAALGRLLGAALGQTPPPSPQGPTLTKFGGTDGHPLVVDLKRAKARYVRLQLNTTDYFHLDEVEIYGTSGAPPAQVQTTQNLSLAPNTAVQTVTTSSSAGGAVGLWTWACCGGGYTGMFAIVSQEPDGTIVGQFAGTNPTDIGTIQGRVRDNQVEFTRRGVFGGTNFEQTWTGRLDTGGGNRRIVGSLFDRTAPQRVLEFSASSVANATMTVSTGGVSQEPLLPGLGGGSATGAAATGPAASTAASPVIVSGQVPSIPVGSYALSRIEITRRYPDSFRNDAYEAGLELLPSDERNLRLGWDFNWGNNKQERNRSMSDLTITDIPLIVRPGSDVSLAAAMKAEWMSSGYGNNDREHKISLAGALGNGQWTDNGANPNVPAQGSFSTTNRFTVPREENGMVVLKTAASIRMGNDHTGDMEVRFVYEPPSAFLRTGTANLNFETGTLDGWFKTGNTFDFQPTYQDNPTSRGRGQPSNHQGTYWIATFEKRHLKTDNAGDVQGDGPTGTLTSVPFTIAGRKMSLLVGGGCDLGTERVELAVAGRAVRKATGKCTESMERVTWDVADYADQAAQIRAIDASDGGWGHINFDDVQMTELVTSAVPPVSAVPAATVAPAPRPAPAAVPATSPTPSTPAPPPAFSVLSFGWELVDANSNKMLEGGERFNIRITVKNSGAAAANNVQVRLAGDPIVVSAVGSQKSAGNVGPGQSQSVDFGGMMPSQLEPRNADILVSLVEGAVELPQTQLLRVGLAPADVRPTTTVLSEVVDVDYPPALVSIPERTSSVAIIIGISNYRESVIPKLPYAGRDAEIFSKYLENVGGVRKENIKILSDDRAARSDIEEAVEEWLPLRVTDTSHVFFYYAGHGALDPSTGETYLVPYEGSPDSPTTRMYPIKRLYEKLGALKVQNVTVFLDSCFSGGGRSIAMKGRPILIQSEAASAPPVMSSVSVLAAAGANQVSSDYEKTRHGMFTYFLLKGMRGEADSSKDSWVDLGELFNYVRDHVRSTSVSELNREQNPALIGGPDLETKKNVKLFMVRK